MRTLTSAFTWTAIVLLILVWLPLMAVVRVLDRDPAHYATGRLFRILGGLLSQVNPAWQIEIAGSLPEDRRGPYVVVGNHQSNADVPVISRLPWEMKWVAKASLFKLPVAGWMMRLAGDIPVDRRDTTSRASVLVRAEHYLKNGCSVMLMPEGTRSRDGRVRRFQDGAFRLAIEAGVPVLPLAIDGTAGALPKADWRFGPADVKLHVFAPISTEGLSAADAPALRERVRRMIMERIADWRGVAPEAVDGTVETVEKAAKSTTTLPEADTAG